MKLIGKGFFSKVYRKGKSKYVYIKSEDYAKECMALGYFPNTTLFPKIMISDDENFDYKMLYYPKVSSVKNSLLPVEYTKYLMLRRLMERLTCNPNYSELYKRFSAIKDKRIRIQLLSALDALTMYGSEVCFEISPRNITASSTKKLILLDCFFMGNQVDEIRCRNSYYHKNKQVEYC